MAKAVSVTHFDPSAIGHGGNHRAFQIRSDLERAVGANNVIHVSVRPWQQSRARDASKPKPTWRSPAARMRRLMRRVALYRAVAQVRSRSRYLFVDHPLDLLAGTSSIIRRFAQPGFLVHYERLVREIDEPAVCVIEHVGFAGLLPINARHGLATIGCFQNIEAFDTVAPLDGEGGREAYLMAIAFADELRVLAQCSARLLISRVEVGMVGGLGLASHYYPYLPVGVIRQKLEEIRRSRQRGAIEPGLLLMLGSSHHPTTGHSFSWFVQQAQERGLPDDVKIVVAGAKTEELLPAGTRVPGLILKGWLEQDELDQLLVQAEAVLAPQTIGFGALTRLPEMSCAGIPVIASRHAVYSLDPPPGVEVVDDEWDAWCAKMKQMIGRGSSVSQVDYDDWARRQGDRLVHTVKQVLGG